jgi:hypothetical protein
MCQRLDSALHSSKSSFKAFRDFLLTVCASGTDAAQRRGTFVVYRTRNVSGAVAKRCPAMVMASSKCTETI